MDEQQLIEFYMSGGDLSTLSDGDLQSLAGALKINPAGPSPAVPGLLKPGSEVPPSAPMDISAGQDPKEFLEWLASVGFQGLGLGAGLIPGGLPLRTGMTGLMGILSGAANPDEGEGRLESALEEGATQAGMEAGFGTAAKALPWAGHQAAVRMGVPPGVRSGGRTRKYVESYLNERRRGGRAGWGRTPAVGQKTTALRKATGQGSLKEELTDKIAEIKQELPERVTPFADVRRRAMQDNQLRDPEKFLGLDDPRAAAEQISSADTKFWEGNEELLGHMQGLGPRGAMGPPAPVNPARTLPPPENTLGGDVPYFGPPEQPNVNFGELVEMAQKQGASAAPTFERTASGQWVRAQDTPARLASRERNRFLKKEAERTARSQPGGNAVADDYLETNARLSDAYRIEQAADKIRRGLAFAGIRGGLGAGLGSGVGMVSGGLLGAGLGGPVGGALGLLATPGNVSRLGSAGGRVAEVAPSAWRIWQLIQELENPPEGEKTPVQLRKP